MVDVRRLAQDEEEAWRRLQVMQVRLTAALSRELAGSGLSYPDYQVLVALARGVGRMRAFELGRELGWEKSRVSHHISRMVDRGLVVRQRCESDQRGAFVVATEDGRRAVAAAAPGHVAAVRRHFVDPLSPAQLETLATIAGTVLEALGDEQDGGPDPAGS